MRIGFIYFHHIHHVYHSAPIAFELSRLRPEYEVILIVTSKGCYDVLEEVATLYPGHRCKFILLRSPFLFKWFNIRKKSYPLPRKMLRNYAEYLNQYDVIVGTSFETNRLMKQFSVTKPSIIFTFHGVGVRQYGFPESLKLYDLLLLPGKHVLEQLKNRDLINGNKWAIIGYPKFDLVRLQHHAPVDYLRKDKVTVVYNPHWNHHVSSWYDWGRKVIDFFAEERKYNLIFAPHLLLKEWKEQWLTLRKYRRYDNILLDFGSKRSIDMTYTMAADIYLGDVSSQVFEFLYKPRPCLFLNSKQLDRSSDMNYPQWDFGKVITDLSELPLALETTLDDHQNYKQLQHDRMMEIIDLQEKPSGKRAAETIISFLEDNP